MVDKNNGIYEAPEPGQSTPGSSPEDEAKGRGVTSQIKEALLSGTTEEELDELGFNHNSVRIVAQELEKAGLRIRPPKPPKGSQKGPVIGRGSALEQIIQTVKMPKAGGTDGFEDGLKFGMSMIVMGVRLAQELSTVGVQQAKPLMDMAKDMRAGEAIAAKTAAYDAAQLAAGEVQANMAPVLAQMGSAMTGVDPMQSLMVRLMEPMMKGVTTKLMGSRLMGGLSAGTEESESGDLPPGWTKRKE